MPDTKYISRVDLPNGVTYVIKDAEARELIESIVAGGVSYIGETTTNLTDGGTDNPITIGGKSVTVVSGNLVTKNAKEFLFDGTTWHEVGDLSKFDDLGDWAYVDSGSVTHTPAGSVSQPTFTGTKVQLAGTTTAAGSVSQPTFSNGAITGSGTVAVPTSAATTVKTSAKSTVSVAASGTTTYQPAGTVSNIAVTLGTKSVNSMNSDGVTPAWTATVNEATETLSFTWNAGSMPTSTPTTVGSGTVTSYTQPTFTGTAVRLQTDSNVPTAFTTTLTDSEKTVDVTGTATGTVSKPTFTGSSAAVTITATADANGNYQPAGTVSKPTFTGTEATVSVTTVPHTP